MLLIEIRSQCPVLLNIEFTNNAGTVLYARMFSNAFDSNTPFRMVEDNGLCNKLEQGPFGTQGSNCLDILQGNPGPHMLD